MAEGLSWRRRCCNDAGMGIEVTRNAVARERHRSTTTFERHSSCEELPTLFSTEGEQMPVASKKSPNLAFQRKVLLAAAISCQKLAVQGRYNLNLVSWRPSLFLTGRCRATAAL